MEGIEIFPQLSHNTQTCGTGGITLGSLALMCFQIAFSPSLWFSKQQKRKKKKKEKKKKKKEVKND